MKRLRKIRKGKILINKPSAVTELRRRVVDLSRQTTIVQGTCDVLVSQVTTLSEKKNTAEKLARDRLQMIGVIASILHKQPYIPVLSQSAFIDRFIDDRSKLEELEALKKSWVYSLFMAQQRIKQKMLRLKYRCTLLLRGMGFGA